MSYNLSILRALVRVSRRKGGVDLDALLVRAGGHRSDARAAIASLERQGLALRTSRGPRVTLAGLAVALASKSRAPARAHPGRAVRRVAA